MNKKRHPILVITADGPYMLSGVTSISRDKLATNEQGVVCAYITHETIPLPGTPCPLCRCGHSDKHPFCDGAHKKHAFKGTSTAPKTAITEDAETFSGKNYTLLDNQNYCAFARFCDAGNRVWHMIESGRPEEERAGVKIAHHCPAGRLTIVVNKNGKRIEPVLKPAVSILEDPALTTSGPLFLKGGITVIDENGYPYEARNRQTLCRCGASSNKPFCDGSHATIHFNDGFFKKKK